MAVFLFALQALTSIIIFMFTPFDKKCIFCKETIKFTAVKCKHCHSNVPPPKKKWWQKIFDRNFLNGALMIALIWAIFAAFSDK